VTASAGSGSISLDMTSSDVERVDLYSTTDDHKITAEGTKESVWIRGGGGDDSIQGGSGDDWIFGHQGNNTLSGGDGNDYLIGGAGSDVMSGGSGEDLLISGSGDDAIDGGDGIDTAYFADAGFGGVDVDLEAGTAIADQGTDSIQKVENVYGSYGADTIRGDAGNNQLSGGYGDDSLSGGDGNDKLLGGAGDDVIDGGSGIDTVSFADAWSTSLDGVNVDLAAGTSSGAGGDDTIENVENVEGSYRNDTIIGDAESNTLQGNWGDDQLSGGAGDDILEGGQGNDTLDGGADNDVARYQGNRDDYEITENEDGTWTIRDTQGQDGEDTLRNVEQLQFADQTFDLNRAPEPDDVAVRVGEDGRVSISLSGSDQDYGDQIESYRIDSLPENGILTLNGHAVVEGQEISAEDVAEGALEFTGAANASGTVQFEYSASDGTVWSLEPGTVEIEVTGVADAAALTVSSSVTVAEDSSVGLPIAASLADVDGSESLTVEIANAPAGTTFSDGVNTVVAGADAVDVSGWDLANLELTPASNSDADFDLEVRATSTESSGDATTVTQDVYVEVTCVADAAVLTVGEDVENQVIEGLEGTVTSLPLSAELVDVDGSESLTIVLRGLPDGTQVSVGTANEDGTWTLTADQLDSLSFTTPLGFSGAFTLEVDAISVESDSGDTAVSTASVQVDIAAADVGYVDDPDGVTNDPEVAGESEIVKSLEGFIDEDPRALSGAKNTVSDSGPILDVTDLQLDQIELDGREIILQGNEMDRLQISDQDVTTLLLGDVDVQFVPADFSELAASETSDERVEVAIDLPAKLPELDNAETVLVSGIPVGATLNHGWQMDSETWVVPPRHIHGLTLKLPAHSTGTMRMKFEVFGAVTSAFISTASVASDYESTGSEDTPASDDPTGQDDFS